ncbi:MAG: hypothetical protein ACXWD3_18540, partial [Mycobacterium sp.]
MGQRVPGATRNARPPAGELGRGRPSFPRRSRTPAGALCAPFLEQSALTAPLRTSPSASAAHADPSIWGGRR